MRCLNFLVCDKSGSNIDSYQLSQVGDVVKWLNLINIKENKIYWLMSHKIIWIIYLLGLTNHINSGSYKINYLWELQYLMGVTYLLIIMVK